MDDSSADDPYPPDCCVPFFLAQAIGDLIGQKVDAKSIARRLNVRVRYHHPNPWGLATHDTDYGISPSEVESALEAILPELSSRLFFRHVPLRTIAMESYTEVISTAISRGAVVGVGLDFSLLRMSGSPSRHVFRVLLATPRDVRFRDPIASRELGTDRLPWDTLLKATRHADDGLWLVGPAGALQLTHTLPWTPPKSISESSPTRRSGMIIVRSDYTAMGIRIVPEPESTKELVACDLHIGGVFRDPGDPSSYEFQAPYKLRPGQCVLFRTREQVSLPAGVFGFLCSRTSLTARGLMVPNTKIDPFFDDHLHIAVFNTSRRTVSIEPGLPFCSIVFCHLEKALPPSQRRKAPEVPHKRRNPLKSFWETHQTQFVAGAITIALSGIAAYLATRAGQTPAASTPTTSNSTAPSTLPSDRDTDAPPTSNPHGSF
jgi:hypothetical protein